MIDKAAEKLVNDDLDKYAHDRLKRKPYQGNVLNSVCELKS